MSAVSKLMLGRLPLETPAPRPESVSEYLGPAVVVSVEGSGALTVARSDGPTMRAEMALALRYEAREGDVLLVIARQDACYVIGVLSGKGKTDLSLQGDVTLRAVGGVAEIVGDEGVRLRGPKLDVQVRSLQVVADTVVQTLSTLIQRVTDSLTVHARTSHTIIEEGAHTQAKTATIRTEETMSINGKQIHLG